MAPHDTPTAQTAATAPVRVAFVQSCWHREIVDRSRDAFTAEMQRRGWAADALEFFEVPGALELPLLVQRLAAGGRFGAVVAAGLIVDGNIYRHEFVASTVLDALMRVQLDTGVPVLSAVLTPKRFAEDGGDDAFFFDHFVVKGTEVATACVETLAAHAALPAG